MNFLRLKALLCVVLCLAFTAPLRTPPDPAYRTYDLSWEDCVPPESRPRLPYETDLHFEPFDTAEGLLLWAEPYPVQPLEVVWIEP